MPVSPIDRRMLLQGLGASAAWPTTAAVAREAGEFAFVAIGDWGREGRQSQRQVAQAMGKTAEEIASRLVLSAGDNFYPAGVKSVADPHWRRSFEDVYTAPALQTPWYVALGNHDYRGAPQAQIDYSALSHRWRMPSRYFKIGGAELGTNLLDIFVMDSSPIVDEGNYDEILQQVARGHVERQDAARQIAWLARELKASRAPWKIVMGHHPVYSGGHGDSAELVEQVAPLLEAHGVQVYLNGHDHSLQHIRRGRVDYVCTGSGAEARDALKAVDGTCYGLSRPGFATFRLDAEQLDLEFRDLTGQTVYRMGRSRAL
ncbi:MULTISPECIES: purple acid phosphatase family protein [Caulobacter]|uniref:purple acid phosphatase family protein n=1 Tax=Caulobacter TaxID=75 RepID=UPI000B024A28|nr:MULTISPECIES: tartrate-resistant acid phosphatase type 5 family protein [Caulobacter]GGL10540.1 acid phosphatase [Caulobacter rhizosphaerae]